MRQKYAHIKLRATVEQLDCVITMRTKLHRDNCSAFFEMWSNKSIL